MRLPVKTKNLLYRFEEALFWDDSADLKDKLHGFYKILRPSFNWLAGRLGAANLVSDEVESELYILCCNIYLGFDRGRSSIVPYLERFIPWYIRVMFNRLDRAGQTEEPVGLTQIEYQVPEIITFSDLIEEKYFTRGQKYLIYVILTSDDKELSQNMLAKTLNIDVRQLRLMLKQLGKQWRKHNGESTS